MSIRIHNGYLLKHGLHPMQFAATLQEKLKLPYQELFFGMMLSHLVDQQEAIERNGGSDNPAPLLESHRVTQEVFNKLGDLEVQVGFGYDPINDLNVMTFYGPNSMLSAFDKLSEVSEYGYWDNADKPIKVSDAEWSERREVWNRVLPNEAIPSATMAFWSLNADSPIVLPLFGQPAEKLESMLPSLALRAQRHARHKLAAEYGLDLGSNSAKLDQMLDEPHRAELMREIEKRLAPSTMNTYSSGKPGTVAQML